MQDAPKQHQPTSERHVALYVRVSTAHQAEEGVSLSAQEARLDAYATANWPSLPARAYREEGKSARHGKHRPAYERMLAAIDAGEVAVVLAAKGDRLARAALDSAYLAKRCYEAKTELHTLASGKIETTAVGKLTYAVLQDIAEFESNLRSERVTEALDYLASNGYWSGGSPPWGYLRGADRILRPSPDAPLIRQAFERYDRGASVSRVRAFLAGAPKQEREIIRLDYVSKLLRNATYAGYLATGTKTGAPELLEGRHGPEYDREPIVPRDLFERVQARLADNKETGYRGQSLSPFGPIARCGRCGATLRIKRLNEQTGGYAYLRCSRDCGRVKQIAVEQLEVWVAAYLSQVPRWIDTALESGEWQFLLGDDVARDKIAAEIAALESGRATIRSLAKRGALGADEAANDLADNEGHLRRLRPIHEQLSADADKVKADLERLREAIDAGKFGAEGVIRFWQRAITRQKQTALASVLERIDLLPEHVAFTFRYGLRGPLPILVPIDRARRSPESTKKYRELGFGLESADRAADSAKFRPESDKPQTHTGSPIEATTQSDRKSRQVARARSADRSRSPPSAAPPGRG